MPFGLCSAQATFEILIEIVLDGLHCKTCLVYLDDIIVCDKTFHDMVKSFDAVKNQEVPAVCKKGGISWACNLRKRCQHRPKEDRMCS